MTTSESKGRFFRKRIDSHNESNRELECSSRRHNVHRINKYHRETSAGLLSLV